MLNWVTLQKEKESTHTVLAFDLFHSKVCIRSILIKEPPINSLLEARERERQRQTENDQDSLYNTQPKILSFIYSAFICICCFCFLSASSLNFNSDWVKIIHSCTQSDTDSERKSEREREKWWIRIENEEWNRQKKAVENLCNGKRVKKLREKEICSVKHEFYEYVVECGVWFVCRFPNISNLNL